MPRPCSVCHHIRLPEISADMAGGVSDVAIAKRYGLARSSVQRHRQHIGAPNAATVAGRKSIAFQALASLPTIDEVGAAYSSIGARIDSIAAKAEAEGSLAVALVGLRELRSTVTAQAQLAGHVGSGAQVQVNTQVNIDVSAAVRELIAAIRPRPDPAIPPELAVHLEGASPDADTLARLEAVADGQ